VWLKVREEKFFQFGKIVLATDLVAGPAEMQAACINSFNM
jgi:hypothetical protein